jgi:hypothetical protein
VFAEPKWKEFDMTDPIPGEEIFPHPAGAVSIDPWRDDGDAVIYRSFTGRSWVVEREHDDIFVHVDGLQYATGAVERWVGLNDHVISPADARQLARLLIAAAEEVDTVASYDPAPGLMAVTDCRRIGRKDS